LPKQRCLLITSNAANRNGRCGQHLLRMAINLAAGAHFGQYTCRYFKQAQQFLIPLQGMNIEEHGAAGIAYISYMSLSVGELPYQPAVDGAKAQIALLCLGPCTRHMIEQPLELGSRKIGISHQAGFFTNHFCSTTLPQAVAVVGGATVLPHNGMVQRLAGVPVPQHGRFPLVGNANARNVLQIDTRFQHGFSGYRQLGGPYFQGIMFYPAGLRKVLGKFFLRHRHDMALIIKENGTRAGSALVERQNITGHASNFSLRITVLDVCSSYTRRMLPMHHCLTVVETNRDSRK